MVTVWERLASIFTQTGELLCELGSDQTSCHNPYSGGQYWNQAEQNMSGVLQVIRRWT